MRIRTLSFLSLAGAAVLTLSLLHGQERPPAPARPVVSTPAAPQPQPQARPPRDLEALKGVQKEAAQSAHRAADWVFRMHGDKGRFLEGRLPALGLDVPGDHFVRQLHAAAALARAARYTNEERFAVRATQAVLALLDDTGPEDGDPTSRHVSLPPVLVDRAAATALLVVAVHELPQPQKDLLDKAEQMCNFLRKQARPDGSVAGDADGVEERAGVVLHALAVSQRHRPADWKAEALRKGLAHQREQWKKGRSMASVPPLSAAFAEAHARTKERAFADFVFEMNDWLAGLQCVRVQRPAWHGGFMAYKNGQAAEVTPTVCDAAYVESLAHACRSARELGDLPHYERYSAAAEHGVRFLMTLQYGTQKTNHYADWYRPALMGGFHYSGEDGNLRIDQTGQAVSALSACLEYVW